MIINIFKILSSACSIYAIICLIRVLLTWFPKANYSEPGKVLSAICDPYLNMFRRLRFLNFNGLDFSPAVAIIVMSIAGQLLGTMALTGKLTLGTLLSSAVYLVWSLFHSIANFLILLLIIRLVAFIIMGIMSRNNGYRSYSPVWDQIDRWITPFIYKITGIFTKRIISFKWALVIAIIASIIFVQLINFGMRFLCSCIAMIPF